MYEVTLIQGTWQQLNTQIKAVIDSVNTDKKKSIVSMSHSSNTTLGIVNYSALIITYTEKK